MSQTSMKEYWNTKSLHDGDKVRFPEIAEDACPVYESVQFRLPQDMTDEQVQIFLDQTNSHILPIELLGCKTNTRNFVNWGVAPHVVSLLYDAQHGCWFPYTSNFGWLRLRRCCWCDMWKFRNCVILIALVSTTLFYYWFDFVEFSMFAIDLFSLVNTLFPCDFFIATSYTCFSRILDLCESNEDELLSLCLTWPKKHVLICNVYQSIFLNENIKCIALRKMLLHQFTM